MRQSKAAAGTGGEGRTNGTDAASGPASKPSRPARGSRRRVNGAQALSEQVIPPSSLDALLMRPAYLDRSAWLEHVPFAFWLTEAHRPRVFVELGTHHGVSYFAFCQAVSRLGLGTRCFAVDTWKGDEHAGFYGEEVFEKVRAVNEAHYSGFSRLVRSSFDDALAHFSDGSIDLLHIDGLHTLEAVRHDFESWRPKLSRRAVVVLHDSNVRERGFGVFRLVEALREVHPCFEFAHGHGLAVVGVGRHRAGPLERLFEAADDDARTHTIREMFARVGRAVADAHALRELGAETRALRAAVAKSRTEEERLREALEQTRAERDRQARAARDARATLSERDERHAEERGRLAERAAFLEGLRDELRRELADATRRADRATGAPGARRGHRSPHHGHEAPTPEPPGDAGQDAQARAPLQGAREKVP